MIKLSKVGEYMASKWELQRDNSMLDNLKSELTSVSTYLKSASVDVNKLAINLDSNYKVNDDSSKAVTRTNTLKTNIENESTYISNTVIPAIDEQIRRNNEEIRRIEEEEERARQAAIEAARAASSKVTSFFKRW
jgi:prefoldin subunit 5